MKILAYDYKINANPGIVTDLVLMGQHNGNELTITICTGMDRQHIESTFIHELLEAINWQLQIGLDERAIINLEIGLYNTLRNAGVDLSPLMRELDKANKK